MCGTKRAVPLEIGIDLLDVLAVPDPERNHVHVFHDRLDRRAQLRGVQDDRQVQAALIGDRLFMELLHFLDGKSSGSGLRLRIPVEPRRVANVEEVVQIVPGQIGRRVPQTKDIILQRAVGLVGAAGQVPGNPLHVLELFAVLRVRGPAADDADIGNPHRLDAFRHAHRGAQGDVVDPFRSVVDPWVMAPHPKAILQVVFVSRIRGFRSAGRGLRGRQGTPSDQCRCPLQKITTIHGCAPFFRNGVGSRFRPTNNDMESTLA